MRKQADPGRDKDIYEKALELFGRGDFQEAAKLAKQQLEANPEDDRIFALIGRMLAALGRHLEAIPNFNSAIEHNPSAADYYAQAARSCIAANLQQDALSYIQKALALEPERAEFHHLLALYYQKYLDVEKSLAAAKKAVELDERMFEAYEIIVSSLETLHKIDEAQFYIDKARSLDEDHPCLQLVTARIFARKGDYVAARRNYEKIINNRDRHGAIRIAAALHDLGKISDREEKYDEAFEFYKESQLMFKQLNEASNLVPLLDFSNVAGVYRQWFSKANTKEWPKTCNLGRKSPVFLIGFPRSGTTLVEQMLSSHHNVVVTQEEPLITDCIRHFPNIFNTTVNFPQILNSMDEEELNELRGFYFTNLDAIFPGGVKDRTAIDKMPLNILNIGLIQRMFPGAKFIMMIRDPRDACLSCFMQAFNHNLAMAKMYTLKDAAQTYAETMNLYEHYRQVFDPDIMEVRYCDLVKDAEKCMRKILGFIGEEWSGEVLRYYEKDKQRTVTTPSYESVTKPVYKTSIGRWKNYERHFRDSKAREILAPFIKKFGYAP